MEPIQELQRLMEDVSHTCVSCGENFPGNRELWRHILLEHVVEADTERSERRRIPIPHVCPYCDKKFSTQLFLTIHAMSLHNYRVLNLCEDCYFEGATAQDLKKHRATPQACEQELAKWKNGLPN